MNPSSTENPVASTPNTPDGAVAVLEVAALRYERMRELLRQRPRDGTVDHPRDLGR